MRFGIDSIKKRELYDRFLAEWSEDRVRSMGLTEYVDVENQETFCYWVERETRILGSILGSPAIKFGIYKRKDDADPVSAYANDAEYSWRPFHGSSREEAFETVRSNILRVIEYSKRGAFSDIDGVRLSPMFKWKIAFLFSSERLVPIYEENTLRRIGEHFGLHLGREISVSEIQDVMMQNMPADLDIYEYMESLWFRFNDDVSQNQELHEIMSDFDEQPPAGQQRIKRKAATNLNTNSQIRSIARSYLVEQKHNRIQESLYNQLVEKFGEDSVSLEENFADIKLRQPDAITYFEVKSSSYALACVREAIGQLLFYAIRDEDSRPKRLVVVGQYPPTPIEEDVIDKLKRQLNIQLSYQHVPLT